MDLYKINTLSTDEIASLPTPYTDNSGDQVLVYKFEAADGYTQTTSVLDFDQLTRFYEYFEKLFSEILVEIRILIGGMQWANMSAAVKTVALKYAAVNKSSIASDYFAEHSAGINFVNSALISERSLKKQQVDSLVNSKIDSVADFIEYVKTSTPIFVDYAKYGGITDIQEYFEITVPTLSLTFTESYQDVLADILAILQNGQSE